MAAIRKSTLTRVQLGSLIALFLICSAAVVHEALLATDAPFLTRGNAASWIGYPFLPTSDAIPVLRENILTTSFVKRFELDRVPSEVILSARGLRSLELSLNGTRLLEGAPLSSWRDLLEVDVTEQLRPGRNELRANVRNPGGPSLLQLALRGEGMNVESDASWEVTISGIAPAQASLARDTQLFSESFIMPSPRDAFG